MSQPFRHVTQSIVLAVLMSSCRGGSPTQPPPASNSPTPATPPPSSPSASPGSASCPFAPGPVQRLALAPRALTSNGVPAQMRTRVVGPGEEVLCLDQDKSHRLDFNLNQRNAQGQECCWVDDPRYRVRGDADHIVESAGPIDDNSFIFRVRVEPRGHEASFGVEAELDGVFSYPWQSGAQYPREPLRVITLAGDDIPAFCPCVYLGNGGYEGGSCVR